MQCPVEPQTTPNLIHHHSLTLDALDSRSDSGNSSSISTVSSNKPDKVLTHEQYSKLCSKKKRYRKKFKKAYKKYKSLEKKYSIIQNRYKSFAKEIKLQLKQQSDVYNTKVQALNKHLLLIQDLNRRMKKQYHLQLNENRKKEKQVKKAMKNVSIMHGNLKQAKRRASKDLEVWNDKQSHYEHIIRECKITEIALRKSLNSSQLKCIEYQKEMVNKCADQIMNHHIHNYQQLKMNVNLRVNINDKSVESLSIILQKEKKSYENMNFSKGNQGRNYRKLCLMKNAHRLNIPQMYHQSSISSPPVIHKTLSFDEFVPTAIYLENLTENEHECGHEG